MILRKYIHSESDKLPLLVRAALVHVQFETIHPFLDGNGRLGRLLITLMLVAGGALREPMLYLSLYFKTHRQAYYDKLQRVRTEGDWEGWLEYFLSGVQETSDQAAETAKRHTLAIRRRPNVNRRPWVDLPDPHCRYINTFRSRPILSVPAAKRSLSLSAPTIRKSVNHLVDLGILEEVTGKQRDRIFTYKSYMNTLAKGTEPLR